MGTIVSSLVTANATPRLAARAGRGLPVKTQARVPDTVTAQAAASITIISTASTDDPEAAALYAELDEIFGEAIALQQAQLEDQDEPLVAVCRLFIEGKAPADRPLAVFMADRTIRGIIHRQGLRYRLSESDREDLLQDLGMMFHGKLLPKLRDAEKVWSVLAITARRLAAAKANRTREIPLEDMVSAKFDSDGQSSTTDGAAARITDLLHEAAGQIESPYDDVDRRLDRQKAIDKFARLVAAVGSDPLKAAYVEDGMHNGQFLDAQALKPSAVSMKSGGALMSRLTFGGIFAKNGADPAADAVAQRIERVPMSWGNKLAKIRIDLGLSVKDFAQVLNTSEALMAQYVSCAMATPVRVWEDAQVLREQGAPEHKALVLRFGRRPMQSIVTDWLVILGKRLGREARHADLARVTGAHKSTVFRWSLAGHKPDLKDLADFEEMVRGNKPPRARRTRGPRKV
jgi:hypothetical protein